LVGNASGEVVGNSDAPGLVGVKGWGVHATIAKMKSKKAISVLGIRMVW
jgi:hypothetical protein